MTGPSAPGPARQRDRPGMPQGQACNAVIPVQELPRVNPQREEGLTTGQLLQRRSDAFRVDLQGLLDGWIVDSSIEGFTHCILYSWVEISEGPGAELVPAPRHEDEAAIHDRAGGQGLCVSVALLALVDEKELEQLFSLVREALCHHGRCANWDRHLPSPLPLPCLRVR